MAIHPAFNDNGSLIHPNGDRTAQRLCWAKRPIRRVHFKIEIDRLHGVKDDELKLSIHLIQAPCLRTDRDRS